MNYKEIYVKLKSEAKETVIAEDFTKVQKPMYVYDGFIGSKTLIKPYTNQNLGFYLDDESLYEDYITFLSKNTIHSLGVDIALIQNMLDNYFGKIQEVEVVYQNALAQNRPVHSISDYKNNGGQCIHKASLGVNLLLIAGYDAKVIWSNVGGENHAFIIIENNGKHYIFDPANHSKMITPTGEIHKIPTLVEKSQSEIEAFYNGLSPLEITQEDEKNKNQKQSENIKIIIPRLRYETRSEKSFISLKVSEIDRYVSNLKSRGLNDEEIKEILRKIKQDIALGNLTPKVKSLQPVYDAIAKEDNIETYFGR